jgi:hypothetical protein
VSPRYEAEAAFANAMGIFEQYEVKHGPRPLRFCEPGD